MFHIDHALASLRFARPRGVLHLGNSSVDVMGPAAATGAANVAFDNATGMSSSRERGEAKSTEIVIELAGTDHEGDPLRTRHAVVHLRGAPPRAGIGVASILERLLGLDGGTPTLPDLYFPYWLPNFDAYLPRLEAGGGTAVEGELFRSGEFASDD